MNLLITILAFIFTLAILITVHEWGHFIVARKLGVKVLRFSLGFGKPIWSRFDKHGTEFCVSMIPLGGYVKMLDEREGEVSASELQHAFNRKPVATRIAVVLAGPIANFIFAALAFTLVYNIGTRDIAHAPAIIGEVQANSPAAIAGLQSQDLIRAVNAQPIQYWPEFVQQIAEHPAESLTLSVMRNQHELQLAIIPGTKKYDDKAIGYIGVVVDEQRIAVIREPLGQAFIQGIKDTGLYSFLTLDAMYKMLIGQLGVEHISGPITIAVYAGSTVQIGFVYFLKFLAFLSISLGVINLLPIPMLDGGHLLYYVVEAIRRKPLSLKIQQMGLSIGIVILFSLMVLAFYNDVIQLGSR
ncbi:MAG: RIP metalloprotease RseP [Gammaproteobacteria bacterium]|jgi:regulator of sigma E protease